MHLALDRRDEEAAHRAQELLSRLAADQFDLAIVGQFSRGKSTLMNAVLGGPYLPMGTLPMTSVITRVRYGSRVRVQVRGAASAFPIETTFSDLARYIAESGEERERLQITSAEIELPAEVLRLGVSFVDTPGVGSSILANTATTERFLPEADALIFVTSAESPLTADERGFFSRTHRYVDKSFVVVNKTDLVANSEVAAVVAFVRDQLAGQLAGVDVPIFAISARQALEAKAAGDPAALAGSGLPALERALHVFLATEKSRQVLLRGAQRARTLVDRQKLDIVLGSKLSNDAGIGRERAVTVDRQVDVLCAEEGRTADLLAERVRRELPSLLQARSRGWEAELQALLVPIADEALRPSPDRPRSISTLRDAGNRLERRAGDALRTRAVNLDRELREDLLGLAAPSLANLAAERRSVAAVVVAALGLPTAGPLPESRPSSRDDLPAVGQLPVRLRWAWPWWYAVAPTGPPHEWANRRLHEDVRRAIARLLLDLVTDGVRVGGEWVEALGRSIQTETRDAARRLRGRLEAAGGDGRLPLLDALQTRLSLFAAGLEHWDEGRPFGVPSTGGRGPRAGCRLCRVLEPVLAAYFGAEQFDLARVEDRRLDHVRRGGFCALHTWQYARIASPLGISVAYAALARSVAQALRTIEGGASTGEELRAGIEGLLPGPDRCPACLALAEAERSAVADLLVRLAQPDGGPVPVLCAPHLAAVLAAQPRLETSRLLVGTLATRLERVSDDMRTYALKRDSLRRDLLTEEEDDAYRQALSALAGSESLALPFTNQEISE